MHGNIRGERLAPIVIESKEDKYFLMDRLDHIRHELNVLAGSRKSLEWIGAALVFNERIGYPLVRLDEQAKQQAILAKESEYLGLVLLFEEALNIHSYDSYIGEVVPEGYITIYPVMLDNSGLQDRSEKICAAINAVKPVDYGEYQKRSVIIDIYHGLANTGNGRDIDAKMKLLEYVLDIVQ